MRVLHEASWSRVKSQERKEVADIHTRRPLLTAAVDVDEALPLQVPLTPVSK